MPKSNQLLPDDAPAETPQEFDPSGDVKPTSTQTVEQIKAWLTAHSIDFTGITLKADLLALVG